jgi:hypothetical protein
VIPAAPLELIAHRKRERIPVACQDEDQGAGTLPAAPTLCHALRC